MKRPFLVPDFFAPDSLSSPVMETAHRQYFPFEVVRFQILCSDSCTPQLQISASHRLPLVLNVAASVKLINYVAVTPSAHFTIPAASPFRRQLVVCNKQNFPKNLPVSPASTARGLEGNL